MGGLEIEREFVRREVNVKHEEIHHVPTKDQIEADSRKARAEYYGSSIAPAAQMGIYQQDPFAVDVVQPFGSRVDGEKSLLSSAKDRVSGFLSWMWAKVTGTESKTEPDEVGPKNLSAEERKKFDDILNIMRRHLQQIKDMNEDEFLTFERMVFHLIEGKKELSQLDRERTVEKFNQKKEHQKESIKARKEGIRILEQKKFLGKFSDLASGMQLLAAGMGFPSYLGTATVLASIGAMADTILDDKAKKWVASFFTSNPNDPKEVDGNVYYMKMGISILALASAIPSLFKPGGVNTFSQIGNIVKGSATIAKAQNEKENNAYDAKILDLGHLTQQDQEKLKASIKSLDRVLREINAYFKNMQQNITNQTETVVAIARFN